MKKKVLSIMLTAMMATSMLAGCGSSSSGSNGSSSTASEEGGYSSEIDMEEDPYEVAIQVVGLPGSDYSAYEADMEGALDEITLPAINCTVDVQFVWISEVSNTTSMAVAGNEKVDLLHVATVQPLSTMVGSEMLIDMNEDNLLQNRGQKLVELFSDTLSAGEVNGQQLAVPAKQYCAAASGIIYNKTVADELGIEIPDEITMDDLEEILTKVHEGKPDMYPYFSGNGELNYLQFLQGYEAYGSEGSYGVVLDSTKETKVENLYDSDLFKDYCVRMFNWTQAGLQPGDPTDTTTTQDYFSASKLFSVVATINPEQRIIWSSRGEQAGIDVGYTTLVDAKVTNSLVTEYMWGIAANSERPDKAMDFLNLMYSNADVANILNYGIEGTNYTRVEGTENVIEKSGNYEPMFFIGGDRSMIYTAVPGTDEYIEEAKEFEATADTSPLCGYMFDDTDFQTESSVIYSTIKEYLPRLQNGMCASEEETLALIDEFNAALDAAGINDVIAANQEQLDAYLAAQ